MSAGQSPAPAAPFSGFWSVSVQDPRCSSSCGGLAGGQCSPSPVCLAAQDREEIGQRPCEELKGATQLSSRLPPPFEWNSVWVAAEGGSALTVFCVQLRRWRLAAGRQAETRNIRETRVSGRRRPLVGELCVGKSYFWGSRGRALGSVSQCIHQS